MVRPADPHARQALLTSARSVFARVGFDNATIQAITEGAGLSKGAFYLHFTSKDECFLTLVHQLLHQVEDLVSHHAHLASQGWKDLVERGAPASQWQHVLLDQARTRNREVLELMWNWRDLVGLLLRGGTGTRFGYLADQLVQRVVEQELRCTRLQQQCGLLRMDVDAEVFIHFVSGGFIALGQHLATASAAPDFARWADSICQLMDSGMGSRHVPDPAGLARMLHAVPALLSTDRPSSQGPEHEHPSTQPSATRRHVARSHGAVAGARLQRRTQTTTTRAAKGKSSHRADPARRHP